MMRRVVLIFMLVPFCAAFAGHGCISFNYVTVDRMTALENQILGAYAELNRELVLVASVRGVGDALDAAKRSPEQRRAVAAFLRMRYNQDDQRDLKQAGCLGEGNDGLLAPRPCPLVSGAPEWATRRDVLVEEENADRLVIMRRVIELNADLAESDLPDVRKAFWRLNVEAARADDPLQQEDGRWGTR